MDTKHERTSDFLFEIGTLRRLFRMHRQTLLADDLSDNIASHTYRVTMIGWILAQMEHVDPYTVVMMCLLHDIGEIRSNDHNWIHKRYVKVFDTEILEDQLGTLPFPELKDFAYEYAARESKASHVAKDADLLEQILLLKEYEWQGSYEARVWLHGKNDDHNAQLGKLRTESAKSLGEAIYNRDPSAWWNDLWTSENR